MKTNIQLTGLKEINFYVKRHLINKDPSLIRFQISILKIASLLFRLLIMIPYETQELSKKVMIQLPEM